MGPGRFIRWCVMGVVVGGCIQPNGADDEGGDSGGDDTGGPCTTRAWFPDGDGDGFGVQEGAVEGCEPPEAEGYADEAGDCDDGEATVYPNAAELCDGLDNDCDGDAADLGLVTFWPVSGPPEPYERKLAGKLLALSDPGTLRLCDGAHTGQLRVSATGLTVEGLGGAALTSLDAQGAGNVVSVEEGAELALSGITLTGGDASRGGGLTCLGAVVTLNGVTIAENHAEDGGGLNAEQGCTLTAQDVTIRGNRADDLGGGARLDEATLTTNGLSLQDNSAGEEGGGMYAQSSVITGESLAAATNTAPLAAGLSWVGTTGSVDQLTLSDNVAEDDGGGLFLRDATLTARAGLASGNACDNAGAAFLLSGTSALTLTNVLITENAARQGAGVWLNSASRFTWSGGGWLNNDPDDVYHGGTSWALAGSGGGSCESGSCVTN
jgi:hypothetical protein